MKKIIPITMILLLVFFASTALAERGYDRKIALVVFAFVLL